MSDGQKFHRGDVVRVASRYVTGWGHNFETDEDVEYNHPDAGKEGIVIGSYADQYGGGRERPTYTLMFKGSTVSWFDEAALTLVRHGTEDDIRAEIAEKEARESRERDFSWIAAHWMEIRDRVPGASAEELMRRVGIDQPWGSQGEGMAWYANWRQTFAALDPILSAMPENPEMAILGIRLPPIDYRIGGEP